jgi:phage FluMu protein Com
MTPDDIAKVMSDNLRMRDKLLECAKECGECGGTGVVKIQREANGQWIETECPQCLDIREILE